MDTLIQGRHNHNENCILVEDFRRTQKLEIYLAKEGSGTAFIKTDLGHSSGSYVGNEFGVMLRGKDFTNQNWFQSPSAYTLS